MTGIVAYVLQETGHRSGAPFRLRAGATAEVSAQVAAFCREPKPAKGIMSELGLRHWKTFQANYLAPLMAMGVFERTIPDKPRSRLQRYRTTEKGRTALVGTGGQDA